ncbi:MAG: LamG domain-containing protein [Gammaproteobacteria bacterium]
MNLPLSLVRTLTVMALLSPITVHAALISHWDFDSGFTDGVGTHGGAAVGDAQISSNARLGGGSLLLDGSDDFVQLSGTLGIGSGSSTVATWVRIPLANTNGLGSTERVGIVLGNYNSTPNSNWELHGAGQMRMWWDNGSINQYGTTDLRDDQWHHVAWVRDTALNRITMYIDGVIERVITGAGTDINFTSAHRIGGDNRDGGGGPSFHGHLDDLRIYDEALDIADVGLLASMTDGNDVPVPAPVSLLLLAAGISLLRRRG